MAQRSIVVNIWENLLASEHVELLNLKTDPSFRQFVESLPKRLATDADTLGFARLISLQHAAIGALDSPIVQRNSGIKKLRRMLESSDEFVHILKHAGKSPHDHCRESGMSEEDIAAMKRGYLNTRQFVIDRPDVVLAPLLRQLVRRH